MTESAVNTLVLYAHYTTRLSYYDDWLEAFAQSPRYDVRSHNVCERAARPAIEQALGDAELVILLHSTNGDTTAYIEPFTEALKARRGLLLTFVGNEVNLPGSTISSKRALFANIEPDFIATQLLPEAGEFLFGDLVRRRVLPVPHALNSNAFAPLTPHDQRSIDIGVRAVRYLAHLGDEDRNRLFGYFDCGEFTPPLNVDISTSRLDRAGWAAFLNRCKGTVSTEAGSWFLERDDHTVEAIRQWTAENRPAGFVIANDSPLRRLGHKLPWSVRAALRKLMSAGPIRHESTVTEDTAFRDVHDRFFRDYPEPEFYGKCISSRHFDAIGTKTCQIMFPGRFNDILTADEHYIALAPDFANIDVVLDRFRDDTHRQQIVDLAYQYVCDSHAYAHRTDAIYNAIQRA